MSEPIERDQVLSDAEIAAGVRALRETRHKFGDNVTDQAIVYAVVFAVREARAAP